MPMLTPLLQTLQFKDKMSLELDMDRTPPT